MHETAKKMKEICIRHTKHYTVDNYGRKQHFHRVGNHKKKCFDL